MKVWNFEKFKHIPGLILVTRDEMVGGKQRHDLSKSSHVLGGEEGQDIKECTFIQCDKNFHKERTGYQESSSEGHVTPLEGNKKGFRASYPLICPQIHSPPFSALSCSVISKDGTS